MPLTAPRYEIAIGSSSYRGIQTMRNCPGCPPKSPRNRYVIVVGVSRTSSRIGTTSNLGMGDPDRFRDGGETGLLEEGTHLLTISSNTARPFGMIAVPTCTAH